MQLNKSDPENIVNKWWFQIGALLLCFWLISKCSVASQNNNAEEIATKPPDLTKEFFANKTRVARECAMYPERCQDSSIYDDDSYEWTLIFAEREFDSYMSSHEGIDYYSWQFDDSSLPIENSFDDSNCDIKGNISYGTGEKIYHLPGDSCYSSVVINTSYGERWFCTEQEAISAGWRHALPGGCD